MKNALMVPVVFCITLLVWTGSLGFFMVLASGHVLSGVLAGHFEVFFQSFSLEALHLLPFTIPLSFLFVYFFLMRHRAPLWLSIPLVGVLAFLSVLALIPLSWRLLTTFSAMEAGLSEALASETHRAYDPGFIRMDAEGARSIWFFSNPDRTLVYPVVTVDPAGRGDANALSVFPEGRYTLESNSLSASGVVIVESAGGIDPLLSTLTDSMNFLRSFRSRIEPALAGFRNAATLGAARYYLEVGAFMLAVLSLWGLSGLTGWRLLNMMISLVAFGALFYGYSALTAGPLVRFASRFALFSERGIPVTSALYGLIALAIWTMVGIPVGLRAFRRKKREDTHD